MKIRMLLAFGAAMSLNAANAQDVDTDAGKTLYLDVCAKCHGPTGKGLASFPKVAGQDADYISSRLEQYRAKEKVGPNSPLMIPNAVNLSDEDIANLSAHIAEDLQ